MTSSSDREFRRLIRSLRHFSEVAMDQWENWRFESKLGPVFVNISRKPEPSATAEAYDDVTSVSVENPADRICRRCDRKVESELYSTVFERMHYACFHYEFEHGDIDVDEDCEAGGCPSRSAGLSTTLADWTDWDGAAFALGRAIRLYERSADYEFVKGDFWTDNARGIGLHAALNALVEGGVLERRDEPDIQYRWAVDQRVG